MSLLIPTSSYDIKVGSTTSVRRRGAGVLSSNPSMSRTSFKQNGNEYETNNEMMEEKFHSFSCIQSADWVLSWLPRQFNRLCKHVDVAKAIHQLTIPVLRHKERGMGAAAIILLTLIVVKMNNNSRQRSLQYHFQIVFRNALRHAGTKFRYPLGNFIAPTTYFNEGPNVTSLSATSGVVFQRTIPVNDYSIFERQRSDALHVGEDQSIPYVYWYEEDLHSLHFSCRRPAWAKRQFLNCNTFHEVSLSRDYQDMRSDARITAPNYQVFDNYVINHGYYRDVWVNNEPAEGTTTILKTTRLHFDFGWRNLFDVHREAIVMERLTEFSSIVTGYGHCGTSVLTEALPHEVEPYVVPGTGRSKKQRLHNVELDMDHPQNDLTPSERLTMALAMAESIAVLHGFAEGSIVHDDIQLQQWLQTADGALKLGDFNRATILEWNSKDKKYCKYSNGETFGNVSTCRAGWSLLRVPCCFVALMRHLRLRSYFFPVSRTRRV